MRARSNRMVIYLFLLSFWVCVNSVGAQGIPVYVGPGDQKLDGMSGSKIIYRDLRNGVLCNWMFDIETGIETLIGGTIDDAIWNDLDIRNDKIAHSSHRGGQYDIFLFNLKSLSETQITDNLLLNDEAPQISEQGIFFMRQDVDNIDPDTSGLYLYDGGSVTKFADGVYCVEMGGDWAVIYVEGVIGVPDG